MAKTEHVILVKDEVCMNPYCNVLIKAGKPAVKITHLIDKDFPEYYHDEECAKKSPNTKWRTL